MTMQLLMAFLLSLAFALALIPLARRQGWMDEPSARKVHTESTPLVGGPAIFLALFITLEWFGLSDYRLLQACTLVLLTGLVDDRWPLTASVRFTAQILACLIMVFGADVMLHDFGRLFMDRVLDLGVLAVPVTVFSALGVINAFNMIDGLDGISGTVFIICCLAMALLASLAGQGGAVAYLLIASAAALGFLALNARWPWNPRARIFLGDSGSVLLGLFLAWMFIDLGSGEDRAFAPMTAVWIIGIPLLDTTRLMGRRWRAGRSAFDADQYHLHHALLKAGLSVRGAWLTITGLCLASALVGVGSEIAGVPEYWRFYAYVALGVIYLRVLNHLFKDHLFNH